METAAADTYALTDDQLEFRATIRQIVADRGPPPAAHIYPKAE
jgi:hypothetical protein